LISVQTDRALGETDEAFDLDLVAAIKLDNLGGARLPGDAEQVALLRLEG